MATLGPGSAESSSPIAAASRTCLRLFEQLSGVFARKDAPIYGITASQVLDQYGQLRIWASNLGALQFKHQPSSLDHRLRDVPKFAAEVVSVLEDLADSLEDVHAIASGERENRSGSPIDLYADDSDEGGGENDDGLELSRRGDVDEDEDEKPEPLSEIHEIFQSIPETISQLFKLSRLIRTSSSRDRFAKALASTSRINVDPRYDIDHVQHKFPRLRSDELKWLGVRLGKAITQRRQYLWYCRDHHAKLGKVPDAGPTTSEMLSASALPTMARTQPSLYTTDDGKSQVSKQLSTLAPSTLAQTTASTVVASRLEGPGILESLDEEMHDDDIRSVTSYASSVGENDEDHRLAVVRFEEIAQPNTRFECPYCWQVQKFSNHRAWKKHVLADLRPYVCTSEGCDMKLFTDFNTWITHELQNHLMEWHCCFCSRPDGFESLNRFRAHLTKDHADFTSQLDESQLAALYETCSKPLDKFTPAACKLCDSWETTLRELNSNIPKDQELVVTLQQFRQHVRRHMEQLALFAIPRGSGCDDDAGEGDSGRAARGRGSDSHDDSRGLSEPPRSASEPDSVYDHEIASGDLPDQTLVPMLHLAASRGMANLVNFLKVQGMVGNDGKLKPDLPDGLKARLREMLTEYGSTFGNVLSAAVSGNIEVFAYLLNLGEDAGLPSNWHLRLLPNDKGETPLHFAARSGHIDAFSNLLRLGFDPQENSFLDQTPLEAASAEDRDALQAAIKRFQTESNLAKDSRSSILGHATNAEDPGIDSKTLSAVREELTVDENLEILLKELDWDPKKDPDLVLALRMSIAEEKAHLEKRAKEDAEAAEKSLPKSIPQAQSPSDEEQDEKELVVIVLGCTNLPKVVEPDGTTVPPSAFVQVMVDEENPYRSLRRTSTSRKTCEPQWCEVIRLKAGANDSLLMAVKEEELDEEKPRPTPLFDGFSRLAIADNVNFDQPQLRAVTVGLPRSNGNFHDSHLWLMLGPATAPVPTRSVRLSCLRRYLGQEEGLFSEHEDMAGRKFTVDMRQNTVFWSDSSDNAGQDTGNDPSSSTSERSLPLFPMKEMPPIDQLVDAGPARELVVVMLGCTYTDGVPSQPDVESSLGMDLVCATLSLGMISEIVGTTGFESCLEDAQWCKTFRFTTKQPYLEIVVETKPNKLSDVGRRHIGRRRTDIPRYVDIESPLLKIVTRRIDNIKEFDGRPMVTPWTCCVRGHRVLDSNIREVCPECQHNRCSNCTQVSPIPDRVELLFMIGPAGAPVPIESDLRLICEKVLKPRGEKWPPWLNEDDDCREYIVDLEAEQVSWRRPPSSVVGHQKVSSQSQPPAAFAPLVAPPIFPSDPPPHLALPLLRFSATTSPPSFPDSPEKEQVSDDGFNQHKTEAEFEGLAPGWVPELELHSGKRFFREQSTGRTMWRMPRDYEDKWGKLPPGWKIRQNPWGKQPPGWKKRPNPDSRLGGAGYLYKETDTGITLTERPLGWSVTDGSQMESTDNTRARHQADQAYDFSGADVRLEQDDNAGTVLSGDYVQPATESVPRESSEIASVQADAKGKGKEKETEEAKGGSGEGKGPPDSANDDGLVAPVSPKLPLPESMSENEPRDSQRPRLARVLEADKRLACSYYKQNPEKFRYEKICRGPGWLTSNGVKEHLYQEHFFRNQCPQCFRVFIDSADGTSAQTLLKEHVQSHTSCRLYRRGGFGADEEAALRNHQGGKDDSQDWFEIWDILFPGQPRPNSPWDDNSWSELDEYAEYLSQDLPPQVRQDIEDDIRKHYPAPGTQSLSRLVDSFQQQQIRLLATWPRWIDARRRNEMDHYESFLAEELPQFIRREIKDSIGEEYSGLGRPLREHIFDGFHLAQRKLFRSWRFARFRKSQDQQNRSESPETNREDLPAIGPQTKSDSLREQEEHTDVLKSPRIKPPKTDAKGKGKEEEEAGDKPLEADNDRASIASDSSGFSLADSMAANDPDSLVRSRRFGVTGPEDIRSSSVDRWEQGRLLGCPFYQQEPRKYTSGSCSGPGWNTASRLKEHLLRVHFVVQCDRCFAKFEDELGSSAEVQLEEHTRSPRLCSEGDPSLQEGFGSSTGRMLSVWEMPTGFTEEEAWFEIWNILFPLKSKPVSPYHIDLSVRETALSGEDFHGNEDPAPLSVGGRASSWTVPPRRRTEVDEIQERLDGRKLQALVDAQLQEGNKTVALDLLSLNATGRREILDRLSREGEEGLGEGLRHVLAAGMVREGFAERDQGSVQLDRSSDGDEISEGATAAESGVSNTEIASSSKDTSTVARVRSDISRLVQTAEESSRKRTPLYRRDRPYRPDK